MPELVNIGKASEIPDGEMQVFELKGVAIAVANTGGRFYAFDDQCTHEQCSLSEGELDGTTVICPCHGSLFDVTSGDVLNGPAEDPISTYDLTVEDDELRVEP